MTTRAVKPVKGRGVPRVYPQRTSVGQKPASRQRKAIIKRKPRRPRGEAERIFDRRGKVFDLRMQGLSYPQIAKRLHCGIKTAWDDVQAELEVRIEQNGEKIEKLRQQELERCDMVIRRMSPKLRHGDDRAANAILRAMARRATLLGLDAPTKIAPTDPTGTKPYEALTDDELKARIAEMVKQADDEPCD